MYIAAKTTNETRDFIKSLLKTNIEINVNENPNLTFISANLEAADHLAIVQIYNNKLKVFKRNSYEDTAVLKLDFIDCIYEL